MTILNLFLTAWQGVTANKLRATLTMLGVIIGVASVIAMLALGNGARAAVDANFRFLGADEIQINARLTIDDGELTSAGKPLTYEEGLRLPAAVELVDRVDIGVNGSAKVRYGRATLDLALAGTTAHALNNLAAAKEVQPVGWPAGQLLTPAAFMGEGRFFTPAEVFDGAKVCVLGAKTAQDLFGGDVALGATLWVNRQRCEVIGVLAELESIEAAERYRNNPNETFYLPVSTAIEWLYPDETPSVNLTAHVTDANRMQEAKALITGYLREAHAVEMDAEGNYADDFNLTTRQDVLGAQQEAASTFALLLAGMAVVSLGVGGIGIMNVMLVSVTERTREIGVRLALGARQRDIVLQFLLEAVLISTGGGLLGVAAGVFAIPLAATLNRGRAILTPESIPLALGVALLTGIAFGLYPALRAARLDPMVALRYD